MMNNNKMEYYIILITKTNIIEKQKEDIGHRKIQYFLQDKK